MLISSAHGYRCTPLNLSELNSEILQHARDHFRGQCQAAGFVPLGEAGQPLSEKDFELLCLPDAKRAIICYKVDGEDKVSTFADSIDDAIERFLGLNTKCMSFDEGC